MSSNVIVSHPKPLTDEINRVHVTKHPVWLIIYSVAVGVGATFSLLSAYYSPITIDSDIFFAFTHGITAIRKHGAFIPALLAVGLILAAYMTAWSWLRASVRLRVLGGITGALLSWSIVTVGAGSPLDGMQFTTPIARHWLSYLCYQGTRWLWLAILFSCGAVWFFAAVIRWVEGDRNSRSAHDIARNDSWSVGADTPARAFVACRRIWWRALRFCRPLFARMSVRNIAIIFVIIMVCWAPWIALMGPANIAADTVAQLVWYRTGRAWDPSSRIDLPAQYAMSDHHPWLTTLLYGAFDQWGVSIGNEALGMWLLAALHAVLLAVAFAITISYLCGTVGLSWKFGVFAVLFVGLIPIYGRLTMSVVKDTTFMPFFMVWSVMYVEYVRRVVAKRKIGAWFVTGLILLAIICGLTKKIGMYVIVAALLVLVIALHRRLISALMLIIIVGISVAIPKVAYPALHIYPGGKQEMMAVQLQQGAAVLLRQGNELSDHDRKALEAVYSCSTDELKQRFTTKTSDDAKDCFNAEATNSQIVQFLVTWAKEGITHPATYLESAPFYYMPFLIDSYYDEGFFVRWGWADKGGTMILPEYTDRETTEAQDYAQQIYYADAGTPIIGLLMTEGFYALWIPLLSIMICIVLRRYRNLLYLVPTIITMGTMIIMPMHQFRYSWPIAFCALLVGAAPFISITKLSAHTVHKKRVEEPESTDSSTNGAITETKEF